MSVFLTANGFPVSRAHIQLPQNGVGFADLKIAEHHINTPIQADEAVELVFEKGNTFKMWCKSAGKQGGFWRVYLVMGMGKLHLPVEPKFYDSIPAKTVVQEIAEEVGEQIDTIELTDIYPFYVRLGSKANQALHTVALPYEDFSWRMTIEGKLWMGEETWPDAPELEVVEEHPDRRTYTVIIDPSLLPGQTCPYGKIHRVTHIVQQRHLRTEIRTL